MSNTAMPSFRGLASPETLDTFRQPLVNLLCVPHGRIPLEQIVEFNQQIGAVAFVGIQSFRLERGSHCQTTSIILIRYEGCHRFFLSAKIACPSV